MSRRGHSLILILVVVAMGAAASAVFFSRLSLEQHRWQPDQVRTQALWLARSAVDAGVIGQRKVATSLGEATVDVQGSGPRGPRKPHLPVPRCPRGHLPTFSTRARSVRNPPGHHGPCQPRLRSLRRGGRGTRVPRPSGTGLVGPTTPRANSRGAGRQGWAEKPRDRVGRQEPQGQPAQAAPWMPGCPSTPGEAETRCSR